MSGQYSHWWYEIFDELPDFKAKCKTCDCIIGRPDGTTSNMRKHVEKKHKIDCDEIMSRYKDKRTDKCKTTREKAKDDVKAQAKLPEIFTKDKKWPANDEKSLAVDEKICEMIALDDLPFSHVEDLGFMRLMRQMAPNYMLKGRKYYSEMTEKIYEKLKTKTQALLNSTIHNGVSFTTDIWSNEYESLLSLTAHSITDDAKRLKLVLHAQPLNAERHTAEHLSETFDNMLENWSIDKKNVHAVVRDGGSNIVKAMSLSELKSVHCLAHELHLVVTKAFESQSAIKSLVQTVKKMATHFNKSDPARKRLAEIQKDDLNGTGVPLKMIQESATRWNSTYEMLDRAYELKAAIALYCSEKSDCEWTVNWHLIPKITKLLKPFKEVTEKISSSNACISDAIPFIKFLLSHVVNFNDKQFIGTMVAELESEMRKRFCGKELIETYIVSTLLDPRYKDKRYITNDACPKAVSILKTLVDDEISMAIEPRSKKNKPENQNSDNQSGLAAFLSQSDKEDSETENNETTEIDKEIESYLKCRRIDHDSDPLLWWKQNATTFPLLSSFAKKYLSAPATSVPSEQLFSGAGIIYEPLRNRLKGEKVEKLLFLKYNLVELKFDY